MTFHLSNRNAPLTLTPPWSTVVVNKSLLILLFSCTLLFRNSSLAFLSPIGVFVQGEKGTFSRRGRNNYNYNNNLSPRGGGGGGGRRRIQRTGDRDSGFSLFHRQPELSKIQRKSSSTAATDFISSPSSKSAAVSSPTTTAITTASTSVSSVTTTTTTTTASDVEACFMKAQSSVQLCSRKTVFSFLVDVLIMIPQSLQKSWPYRMLRLAAAAWKVSLAVNLSRYSATRFQHGEGGDNQSNRVDNLPEIVNTNYRIMARLWRQTAFVLPALTCAELAAVLHGRFPWMLQVYVGSVATAMLASRVVSARRFHRFLRQHQQQQHQQQQQQHGGSLAIMKPTLRKAHITIRNMAICTGAVSAQSAATLVTALLEPRAHQMIPDLLNFRTRVTLAWLVWQFRQALTEAFEAAWDQQLTPHIRAQIFRAESHFFDKAAEVFHIDSVIKVIGALVVIVKVMADRYRWLSHPITSYFKPS